MPSDPSAPIRQVAAGRADLAISYEPEVLLARDQGLPVMAVAALVPRPLTSLISLPEAGIDDAARPARQDDRDRRHPLPGRLPRRDPRRREGSRPDDVEQVDVGLGLLPAVLSGRADAMLGGFLNVEGVDLAERGRDPRVVPVDELGIPTYDELVLVANSDRVADDPEPMRLFIAALERGTRAAVADPEAATEAILDAGDGPRAEADRAPRSTRTLPLLLPALRRRQRFGYMDAEEWERFAGFIADRGPDRHPAASAAELLTERASCRARSRSRRSALSGRQPQRRAPADGPV